VVEPQIHQHIERIAVHNVAYDSTHDVLTWKLEGVL
jgi:hypothetical protein